MNKKNYYSLRLLGSNAFHIKGDVLKTTNKVLNIGETADCEIRYEAERYEPDLYATIIENEDGKSWRLVQRSPYVKARIAGVGHVDYVYSLKDGDVVSFDGQGMEMEFHVHHDSNYGKTGIVIEQRTNKHVLYSVAISVVLLVAVITSLFFHSKSEEIGYDDLEKFLSSVYIIKVDSVQWVETKAGVDSVIATKYMEEGGAVGTAFITTGGKMITARHCIEYWIGDNVDVTTKTKDLSDDDIKKWVIMSEKYNIEHEEEDVSQQLRVFFSICSPQLPDEPIMAFCSTDSCVHINKYRDGFLELGDFSDTYYWRTVVPYYGNDLERELGDFVYIDVPQVGNIELADSAMIAQLEQSDPVAVLGFPNISSGKKTTYAVGKITESRNVSAILSSPDILFDANITHGFSGGPVFIRAKSDGRIVVAGAVSKIDTDNGIYKKAVPVTEIMNMEKEKEDL